MSEDTKKCSKCGTEGLKEDFPIMVKFPGKTMYRAHCKDCDKKLGKHRRDIKKLHGNPPDMYVCQICLRNEEELRDQTNAKSLWALDHNHDNGEFRGWLCHPCNRAIGILNDDISLLKRAIQHLEYKEIP